MFTLVFLKCAHYSSTDIGTQMSNDNIHYDRMGNKVVKKSKLFKSPPISPIKRLSFHRAFCDFNHNPSGLFSIYFNSAIKCTDDLNALMYKYDSIFSVFFSGIA